MLTASKFLGREKIIDKRLRKESSKFSNSNKSLSWKMSHDVLFHELQCFPSVSVPSIRHGLFISEMGKSSHFFTWVRSSRVCLDLTWPDLIIMLSWLENKPPETNQYICKGLRYTLIFFLNLKCKKRYD